jgi:Reverse transcriptase (RNA-dependent DNA polymerase)
MPDNLAQAFALPNLRRAWRWITTNPEPQFKNYVRHIYRAYSLCAEENLTDLHSRLVKRSFTAHHSTKLFFPKKSGILRPYSLLCVEDQIVYQAIMNIVAESFPVHIRRRYQKQVFGHLYAGKRSRVFCKSWKSAYAKFSEALRKAFADGFLYTASFDLTACYDSIDHRVLKHFLLDLKFEPEFCDYLCELLRTWTSSSSSVPIYQGHGIPQGPPPSGLLSECVLRHFDDNGPASKAIRYFRYVDDIRLFAKSEKSIRKRLILLDRISKEVGLFPQSSKIDIHKVRDIDAEIKTISNPPEIILEPPHPDQKKIRRRIAQLTPRLNINNETRFKYVLGRATPRADLSKRLLKILEREPHLYVPISHHLMKVERLSRDNSRQCLQLAKAYDLYPAFTASLLTVLRGRIHPAYQLELIRHCKYLLIADPDRYEDPELEVATISVLLESGTLSWNQTRFNVLRRKDWWVRSEIIRYVQKELIGNPSYEFLLNGLLRDKSVDVSLVGADFMITESGVVTEPRSGVNKIAQLALKAAGIISRVSATVCPISESMITILDPSLSIINWRKLLGPSYLNTIPKIIRWRGYATTDSTAWVNITDTINDVFLNALYTKDATIGTYILGSIGSVLTPGPGNRFMAKYPKLFNAVAEINRKRKESDLSHPITRLTGRPTRHIRFSELPPLRRALKDGYYEMWSLLGL